LGSLREWAAFFHSFNSGTDNLLFSVYLNFLILNWQHFFRSIPFAHNTPIEGEKGQNTGLEIFFFGCI
jgi:hypothetical protein